jgi:charged multivesicular body protein 1
MYTRLENQIDAISSELERATTLKSFHRSIDRSINGIGNAVTDPEKLSEAMNTMNKMEQMFETMTVQGEAINEVTSKITSVYTPQDKVEELIQKVADDYGIRLESDMRNISIRGLGLNSKIEKSSEEQDSLASRLDKLQQGPLLNKK